MLAPRTSGTFHTTTTWRPVGTVRVGLAARSGVARTTTELVALVVPSALVAVRVTTYDPARAYVCENFACRAPISDPAALSAALDD